MQDEARRASADGEGSARGGGRACLRDARAECRHRLRPARALDPAKIAPLATCGANVVKTPVPDIVDERRSLAPFFGRLAELERGDEVVRPLRIAIYGDSNLTSDFLPGHLRRVLQARYGDAGHGWVSLSRPWGSYRHEDVSNAGFWPMFKLYAPTTHIAHDKQYGFANMAAESNEIGASAWAGTTKDPKSKVGQSVSRFELHYLKQPRGGSFTVQIDRKDVRTIETRAPAFEAGIETFEVDDGPHELRCVVRGDGKVRLFGASLDRSPAANGDEPGKPGIQIDSLGAGALNYERLTWVANDTRRPQLVRRAYNLVVIWLGMNVMFVPPNREYAKTFITELQAALPSVPLLVLGPGDTVKEGQTKSDPRIIAVSKQMREVAAETGRRLLGLPRGDGRRRLNHRLHQARAHRQGPHPLRPRRQPPHGRSPPLRAVELVRGARHRTSAGRLPRRGRRRASTLTGAPPGPRSAMVLPMRRSLVVALALAGTAACSYIFELPATSEIPAPETDAGNADALAGRARPGRAAAVRRAAGDPVLREQDHAVALVQRLRRRALPRAREPRDGAGDGRPAPALERRRPLVAPLAPREHPRRHERHGVDHACARLRSRRPHALVRSPRLRLGHDQRAALGDRARRRERPLLRPPRGRRHHVVVHPGVRSGRRRDRAHRRSTALIPIARGRWQRFALEVVFAPTPSVTLDIDGARTSTAGVAPLERAPASVTIGAKLVPIGSVTLFQDNVLVTSP